jgi:baculoviral IAP repeat-containing protein 6 (apollon)
MHGGTKIVAVFALCNVQEIYEPPAPSSPPSQQKPSTTQVLSIPPHSLVAFGLFLRLPGYAEVLLKEKCKAQCLLRLILGVTDDGDGGEFLGLCKYSSVGSL